MNKACWTCRSRTIQCDQSRSPCAKCEKAGLECFDKRPLRWVKGVAIRGKMRGRLYEYSNADSISKSQPQLERKQKRIVASGVKCLAVENEIPAFALQDPRISNLDRASRYYMDYYNNRICKLFILYDSESNPFRHLLSYALDDSTLQQCIVALAARHFANSGQSFDQANVIVSPRFIQANVDALHFKRQTIGAVSRQLTRPELGKKDATMATILLLIFLDLLESGIDGWDYHLQGAKGLVNLYQSLNASGQSDDSGETALEVRRFIDRQFSLIATFGATLSAPKSRSEFSISGDGNWHPESVVRSFLGCPEFILKAIHFFSNQRDLIAELRRHGEMAFDADIRDTVAMLELTENFDCAEWASDFQISSPSTVDAQKISNLSLAYKKATLLYGRRALGALKETVPANEDLVLELIALIDDLQSDTTLFKCLLWPTFIAGLECQTEAQQNVVLQSMRLLWDLTSCLNIISASKILQHRWRQKASMGSLKCDVPSLYRIDRDWLLI